MHSVLINHILIEINSDDMNYPIGIQTFEKIRTNDFAYVDKIGVYFSSEERGIKDWKVTI